MSQDWAERQRRTNRLTRLAASYLFKQDEIASDQLFGLCRLAWITKNFTGPTSTYVKSAKIPALELIFDRDYSGMSLRKVANDVAKTLGRENARELVFEDTGFSAFYPAYWNSSQLWVSENFERLLPLFHSAFRAKNEANRREIIERVQSLPMILQPNGKRPMNPARLLTPAFFSLDKQIMFPIINGNKNVTKLLTVLGVRDASLVEQFNAMTAAIGRGGINDAADLDQVVKDDLVAVLGSPGKKPTRNRLSQKSRANLGLKDEEDIEGVRKALTVKQRRKHNRLTNRLLKTLSGFTLYEGKRLDAMYDVMVSKYDEDDHDLLIEVKSTADVANMRMAIGQLMDYWFVEYGDVKPHVAMLFPKRPHRRIRKTLRWMRIGIMWFADGRLRTCTRGLKHLEADCGDEIKEPAGTG